MRFEFSTAARVVFGPGAVQGIPAAARRMGRRPLILHGASREAAGALARELGAALFAVAGEPSIETVRQGVEAAREGGCDVVIGLGGGSAIDAAKAVAALLTNGGDPLDYLEVIGRGLSLRSPSAPCIAVPTTAGTGAEVTKNAVLASPEHGVKASLRSPFLLPALAVVDPDLTLDLPPSVTASTGLDALTQLIEPYVSSRSNPMADLFCLEGMSRAARALPRLREDGRDREAREDMAMASLLGGLALANAGLGAVHGFAAPIGGLFAAPHGAVCAALLPHVMEVNLRALLGRTPESDRLARYETVARTLTGDPQATAEYGVVWVRSLCGKLKIPPLGSYGVGEEHLADLVSKGAQASSMKANPVALTDRELEEILRRAL